MKKELAIVSIAVAGFMASVTTTWAVPYRFTFSGADLTSFVSAFAPNNYTPAQLGITDGAMRYTFKTDGGTASWSSWQAGTSGYFSEWAETTNSRLTMFNLWGYGDDQSANAAAWGESFTVNSWTNSGTANMNWQSFLYSDAETLGNEVLAFGSLTGYYNAIAFNASKTPTFSFTLDLDTATTPWLDGINGQLVFWYGGIMVNSANADRGTLQGNMTLTGTAAPVPEPTTMLLFGAGLAGLAFVGRKNHKSNG